MRPLALILGFFGTIARFIRDMRTMEDHPAFWALFGQERQKFGGGGGGLCGVALQHRYQ